MLKIEKLCAKVNDKVILDNFNLEVNDDEVHVIMGPNGVGKSTICKCILGHPDYIVKSKTLEFDGNDLSKLNVSERASLGIFLLMQSPTEVTGVTNAEMLRMALVNKGEKESIFEFNKRINKVCEKLNIDKSFIHKNINERMSGGEKKKNELMQLYLLSPKLILLDELDSGLDVDSLESLSKALNEYKKETKCSIIIITHHTNILDYIHPDKVHILENGQIVKTGDINLAEKIEKNGFKGAFNVSESEIHE